MKPNFIIIGAARSGTTSLYKYLDAHPDIFMSDIKEINFFSNERYWKKGKKWYEAHFRGAVESAIGEASTSYTNYPIMQNVPRRLAEYLPDVKFIYILRDPIDRLVSHYLHKIRRGEERRELTEIIYNYPDDQLIWQGKYYSQLEQYMEYFSMNSFLIITINELKDKPDVVVKKIYKFLGVSHDFNHTNLKKAHNANRSITRKNWFGHKVLHFYHKSIEQRNFPYPFKKLFINLAEIGAVEISNPKLSDDNCKHLKDIFREDVEKITKTLGVENLGWRDYF